MSEQQRNGRRKSKIKPYWGEVEVSVQGLKDSEGGHRQMYVDASLDQSGWSPWALEQLLHLVIHHPYEEASDLAKRFGLRVSSSELERLSKPYRQSCQQSLHTRLLQETPSLEQNFKPDAHASGRMMVFQTDGVRVLKGPENGKCAGMEIKSVVLYPQNAPQDRVMLAEGGSSAEFLPLLAGLTKRFCHNQDFIVGVGDAAPWVEEALD